MNHAIEGFYKQRIIRDRVKFTYQSHLSFTLTNITIAGFLFGIYEGHLSERLLLMWTAGLIVLVLLEMMLYSAYMFGQEKYEAQVWERAHLTLNLLGCIGIGTGIWIVQGSDLPMKSLPITIVTLVYAVLLYSMHPYSKRVFGLCILGLLLPMVVFYALQRTTQGILFMIALVAIGLMLLSCAAASSRLFNLSTVNYYRLKDLSINLQFEKDINEVALDLVQAGHQAQTMFFMAASHDLKQPLHAIGLLAEALKQEKELPQAAQETIRQMEQSIHNLSHMFDQFLDIERIEAGRLEVNVQTVSLQTIFNEVVRQYGLQAAEKGLQLRMTVTDAVVRTDAILLLRMLGNLVSNAIQHTQEGTVWIGYRQSHQTIEVRDSGIGISPEFNQDIFKDFYRVRSDVVAHHGHGLGLSIVWRLAQVLQTPVSVRSALGRGSLFQINIPVVIKEGRKQGFSTLFSNEENKCTATEEFNAAGVLLKNKRVLLIESDSMAQKRLMSQLNAWSMDVRTALNSKEALRLMSTKPADETDGTHWQPDIILCDYHLGLQTWLELALSIRLSDDTGVKNNYHLEGWHCPTIFMTNSLAFMNEGVGVKNSRVILKLAHADVLQKTMLDVLNLK